MCGSRFRSWYVRSTGWLFVGTFPVFPLFPVDLDQKNDLPLYIAIWLASWNSRNDLEFSTVSHAPSLEQDREHNWEQPVIRGFDTAIPAATLVAPDIAPIPMSSGSGRRGSYPSASTRPAVSVSTFQGFH